MRMYITLIRMVLTEKQKQDLNRSILEYLMSDGGTELFPKTIEAFKSEANITDTSDFGKNLLEKKWTSVVRLQKKVMDLEAQISEMHKRGHGLGMGLAEVLGSPGAHASGESRLLPKGPAKTTLSGHRGSILCVDVHPTYSLVASGSDDATVKIWDYETGQYERTLKGHTGSVTGLAFNNPASGVSLLATCSSDMSGKLWDLTTFNCIKTFRDHDHTISSIKFVPSGDYLVSCSRDKTVKFWEVSSGYCSKTLTGHNDWVKCLAVSADGQHVASAGSDQVIMIWKFSTGICEQVLRGHEHVIECLSFGKKPTTATDILSPSKQSSSVLLTPQKESSSEEKLSSSESSLSIERSYLASGSRDKTVRLWDAFKGVCLMVFTDNDNWVRGVLVHISGKYVISCGEDKTIRVFDIKENRCMRTIADAHTHFLTCMAMSSIHPVLVTGSVDKNLSIWSCQ